MARGKTTVEKHERKKELKAGERTRKEAWEDVREDNPEIVGLERIEDKDDTWVFVTVERHYDP